MRTSLLLAGAGLLTVAIGVSPASSGPSQSAVSASNVDVSQLGPQPGDKVPDFTLPDQDGRRRSLSSLMGEQGLVLVFSRTADW